ncbi:hypothetical protein [Paenibacillus pinihumi]|nr:hypothetical protein [Paenibacillus pinihumi]
MSKSDLSKPRIIGYREVPKAEQVENKALLQERLRKIGVLKNNKD